MSDYDITVGTIAMVIVLFAFKALVFGSLDAAMVTRTRRQTPFGRALVIHFSALVFQSLGWIVVYSSILWATLRKQTVVGEVQLVDRLLILLIAVAVISTGMLLLREVRRLGDGGAAPEDGLAARLALVEAANRVLEEDNRALRAALEGLR